MPYENFTDQVETNTFIFVIDKTIGARNRRFTVHKAILTDFAMLDPERFQDRELCAMSFKKAAKNYRINGKNLRMWEGKILIKFVTGILNNKRDFTVSFLRRKNLFSVIFKKSFF